MNENKRYKYYEEENGEFPFPSIKTDNGKTIVSLYECYGLLNEQEERIKELEKDRDFWKYNCCSRDNLNSILSFELELAQKQGYELSDSFNEYRESVEKNLEWNKQHLNDDVDNDKTKIDYDVAREYAMKYIMGYGLTRSETLLVEDFMENVFVLAMTMKRGMIE